MGLMSPVLITGKLFFQDSWCRCVGWDELLLDDLGTRWCNWLKRLPDFRDVCIQRWVGTRVGEYCQIHVFCDASERAYWAVLYIHSKHRAETSVRIVCSKNRLAPLKRVTLPSLELIAALVGARLLHYFCSDIGLDITGAVLWSDSTVALEWICSDPNRYKTFVANRVTEIQTYTSLTMEALSRRRKPCGPAVTRSHDRALAAATDLVARPIVVVKGPVPLAEPATTNAAPITGREDSLSFRAVRDDTRLTYGALPLLFLLEAASPHGLDPSLCATRETETTNCGRVGRHGA